MSSDEEKVNLVRKYVWTGYTHTYVHAYGRVIAQLCNIHLDIVLVCTYVHSHSCGAL